MSIFTEVKDQITARKAAEFYGLKVGRNGMACCPFHSDKHPSMKIDRNYHCFACGVGGDAVDYVSRMFGLSQLDAAKKLIQDFSLSVETEGNAPFDEQRKREIRKLREEEKRIRRIKDRFFKWNRDTVNELQNCRAIIQNMGEFMQRKSPEIVFSEAYAQMIHSEPLIEYWLDILCLGTLEEQQELFLKGREEVNLHVERIRICKERILERNRESA